MTGKVMEMSWKFIGLKGWGMFCLEKAHFSDIYFFLPPHWSLENKTWLPTETSRQIMITWWLYTFFFFRDPYINHNMICFSRQRNSCFFILKSKWSHIFSPIHLLKDGYFIYKGYILNTVGIVDWKNKTNRKL